MLDLSKYCFLYRNQHLQPRIICIFAKFVVPLHPRFVAARHPNSAICRTRGAIAQLVEQRTENPCVTGSIPVGTTKKRLVRASFFVPIEGLSQGSYLTTFERLLQFSAIFDSRWHHEKRLARASFFVPIAGLSHASFLPVGEQNGFPQFDRVVDELRMVYVAQI